MFTPVTRVAFARFSVRTISGPNGASIAAGKIKPEESFAARLQRPTSNAIVESIVGEKAGTRRGPHDLDRIGFDGILRGGTDDSRRARHHARPVARTGREVGAGPDRADIGRRRSGAAPPVDLFRTLQRGATHRARPAQ